MKGDWNTLKIEYGKAISFLRQPTSTAQGARPGGIDWVKENKEDAGIAKAAEKAKKAFAGTEIKGKKL